MMIDRKGSRRLPAIYVYGGTLGAAGGDGSAAAVTSEPAGAEDDGGGLTALAGAAGFGKPGGLGAGVGAPPPHPVNHSDALIAMAARGFHWNDERVTDSDPVSSLHLVDHLGVAAAGGDSCPAANAVATKLV